MYVYIDREKQKSRKEISKNKKIECQGRLELESVADEILERDEIGIG